MKTIILTTITAIGLIAIYSCSKKETAEPTTPTPVPSAPTNTVVPTNTVTPTTSTITYSNTVNAILISNGCTNNYCHGPVLNYAWIKAKVDVGTFRNRVIVQKDMPPGGPLSAETIAKLQEWIDNGAPE